MESCLAVCLDLLGTCIRILTDEITHAQPMFLLVASITHSLHVLATFVQGVQMGLINHTCIDIDSTFFPKVAFGEFHPLPNQRAREGRE